MHLAAVVEIEIACAAARAVGVGRVRVVALHLEHLVGEERECEIAALRGASDDVRGRHEGAVHLRMYDGSQSIESSDVGRGGSESVEATTRTRRKCAHTSLQPRTLL